MSTPSHIFFLVDRCQRSPNLKKFPQGVSEVSHPATDEEEEEDQPLRRKQIQK